MRAGSEGTTGGRRWSPLVAPNEPDEVLRAPSASERSETRRVNPGRCDARRGLRDGDGGRAALPLPRPRPVLMT